MAPIPLPSLQSGRSARFCWWLQFRSQRFEVDDFRFQRVVQFGLARHQVLEPVGAFERLQLAVEQ
jgi:hypothetical protein